MATLAEEKREDAREDMFHSPIKLNIFTLGCSEKENGRPSQSKSTNNNKDWLRPLFSVSRVIPIRPTDLTRGDSSKISSIDQQQRSSDSLPKRIRGTINQDCKITSSSSDENIHKGLESQAIKIVCGKSTNRKLSKQFHVQEAIDCSLTSLDVQNSKSDKIYSSPNDNADEYIVQNRKTELSSGSLTTNNASYLSSQRRDEKKVYPRDKKDSITDYGIVTSETVSPIVSNKEKKHRKCSLDAKMSVASSNRRRDSLDDNILFTAGSPKTDRNSPLQSPGKGGRKQFVPGSFTSSTNQLNQFSSKRRESKDGILKRVDSKGEISPMSLRIRRRANSVDPTWQLRAAQEFRNTRSPTLPDISTNPAPQHAEDHKRRSSSVDRVMRDYRLSQREVKALRCILNKVDLYDDAVRSALKPVLSVSTPMINEEGEDDDDADAEKLSDKVIKDAEKESLKQKLFMSRKELDSYISFTRKMEKEKKQTNSEKEELRTRVQWLEKRLSLMESESKALKIERAEFLNQIYRLRCPANVPINERENSGRVSVLSSDSSDEVEVSKQRLKYEADAFATERAKMIKERQRLDEEVRKVQIRCVSLLAQLQHAEKTIDDLQVEKDALKSKLGKSSQQLNDDTKSLQDQLKRFENLLLDGKSDQGFSNKGDIEYRLVSLFEFVKDNQATKAELENQALTLENQLEESRREIRELREEKLTLDTEIMALRTDLEGVTNARNEAELRLSESDSVKLQSVSENRSLSDAVARYKEERVKLASEIDRLSDTLMKMEQEKVSMEADHDVFENFLEMLSIELEEKLGEDHVTQDAEAGSLKEKAEVVGRQVRAHLAPARKLQDDYDDIKEELEDLRKENDALKYAMSCRVQIASIQQQPVQCNCKHEKEILERELDEMVGRIETLEGEVGRLHDDKQSLLMSLMNLQAASRSREPSNADLSEASETDENGDDEDEDDEELESSEAEDEANDQLTPMVIQPSKKVSTGSEVKLLLKYEDFGSDGEKAHSDEDVKGKRKVGKTLSLPNPLARPSKSAENIHDYAHSDNLVQDLDKQLKEMTKTKEKLEEERAGMLDALVSQVEQVEDLKAEVDRLHQALEENCQDDSFSSQGHNCPQCAKSTTEISQYLKIIEDLTEDKLRLEKLLGDVRRDKEKLVRDLEDETDEKFMVQNKVEKAVKERDDALNTAREEVNYLMQSLENLQQDNSSLEEHLEKLRQDKTELLNTLKAAEEDKLRLVQSLQVLSDQKGSLTERSPKYSTNGSETHSDAPESYDREAVATDQHHYFDDDPSFATDQLPDDAAEAMDISHLVTRVKQLESSIAKYQETNTELTHTVQALTGLLVESDDKKRSTERGNTEDEPVSTEEVIALESSMDDEEQRQKNTQNTYLEIREGPVGAETGKELISATDLNGNNLGSKTLCFQISFNGITLTEPGKISVFK